MRCIEIIWAHSGMCTAVWQIVKLVVRVSQEITREDDSIWRGRGTWHQVNSFQFRLLCTASSSSLGLFPIFCLGLGSCDCFCDYYFLFRHILFHVLRNPFLPTIFYKASLQTTLSRVSAWCLRKRPRTRRVLSVWKYLGLEETSFVPSHLPCEL